MDTERLVGLKAARDPGQWSDLLYTLVGDTGFERVLFFVVNSRHARLESAIVRSNFSPEWRERYDRNGFAYIDPTVAHCLNSTIPLAWDAATFVTPQQQALYEEACAFGLRHGVVLPMHGPGGEFGILSVASGSEPGDAAGRMANAALPALALIRDYAFASSTLLRQPQARQEEPPRLTRRELEVLQWVTVGKSSWEIAKITNCSEATVNFHLANVRQKFNVNTRQQAVVKAITLGLISPEDHHR